MMQDPEIELWALDEVIFQLHGTTCKMWVAPEDSDPVVYHNPVKKNVKYYGAVRLCPVCGGRLSDQLPDKEGVLTDLFLTTENTRIVNSEVVIERDFDHVRDEEDENFPLDTPHLLVAVCNVVFDSTGVCTAFDIEEVRITE